MYRKIGTTSNTFFGVCEWVSVVSVFTLGTETRFVLQRVFLLEKHEKCNSKESIKISLCFIVKGLHNVAKMASDLTSSQDKHITPGDVPLGK